MEIKYFNSNFDKITQNKDTDQSITNVIEKLPSLNIVSDKNLLEETIKISKQFKEKKEKIIVFGTGGSNLGARALNNVISNNKIILEFYDNIVYCVDSSMKLGKYGEILLIKNNVFYRGTLDGELIEL